MQESVSRLCREKIQQQNSPPASPVLEDRGIRRRLPFVITANPPHSFGRISLRLSLLPEGFTLRALSTLNNAG
jgi:hypothetical protein